MAFLLARRHWGTMLQTQPPSLNYHLQYQCSTRQQGTTFAKASPVVQYTRNANEIPCLPRYFKEGRTAVRRYIHVFKTIYETASGLGIEAKEVCDETQ